MSLSQDRVALLATSHNNASEKLDYFILGVSLAICAYLAQTNPYAQIGINKETFLLGTLLVFVASAICGLKRIESTISDLRINAALLKEQDPALRAYCLQKLGENRKSHNLYKARNYLLGIALLCYLATNVWAAYQVS